MVALLSFATSVDSMSVLARYYSYNEFSGSGGHTLVGLLGSFRASALNGLRDVVGSVPFREQVSNCVIVSRDYGA